VQPLSFLVLICLSLSYDLYKSGDDGHVFPPRTFYEFRGERLTWNSFCSQVESRELGKYASSIHVVKTFGDKTMEVMALFEREVMDKKYKAEEADVILSTTHAAKGMEWDNVQVCDDFADLFKVTCDGPLVPKRGGAGSNAKRSSWQFHIKQWGDEVNLLYVACTRAKRLLSIPPPIKAFLQDCDMLHDMIRCRKLFKETDGSISSDIVVFGRNQPLSVQDALDVYQDVVVPLRMENDLQTKQHLMKVLVKPLDGEVDHDDDKSMEGDDEFATFFGCQMNSTGASISGPKAATSKSAKPEANGGSPVKKPKLSRAHYTLEDAKISALVIPKGTKRPYDKRESSISGSASCRECSAKIALGTPRVGVQVYKPEHSQFWCSYFHEQCFPKELLPQLRLDPNPNRMKPTTAKKSWSGRKNHGGGYKKNSSWNNGWKGGYRKRW